MGRLIAALIVAVIAGYFTIRLLVETLGQAYEMIGTLAGLAVTVLVFWFASQEIMKSYNKRKGGGADGAGENTSASQAHKSGSGDSDVKK